MHAVLTATASFALCLALYVSASGGIFEISRVFRANIQTYLNLGQSRAPWSHEPYCPSERYCVYTFNTTSSDSVSLIFTPANAEKAKKTLQKTNVSELTQDGAEEAKAWRVVDIPAKDKGVIATRKIEKYETIMVDHAAVIMDVDVEEELTSNLLKVAVNRLHQANTIHALGASTSKGTLEQRIMKTNAFGTTVAGVGSKALFPLVSVILLPPLTFSQEANTLCAVENQPRLRPKRIRPLLPLRSSHVDKSIRAHLGQRRNHNLMYLHSTTFSTIYSRRPQISL
jgi:hypothetical protein